MSRLRVTIACPRSFMARLAAQFDAVIHFDETRAVEPLPHSEEEERQLSELPEMYPTGV